MNNTKPADIRIEPQTSHNTDLIRRRDAYGLYFSVRANSITPDIVKFLDKSSQYC